MSKSFSYPEADKKAIYRVMAERRDMRHFNGQPLEETTLGRILAAAHLAPSVGLMQPWRFIRIKNYDIKHSIHLLVDKERNLLRKP
ncbi:hypothetical protein A3743_08315 [Oleiphilus sp. HI0072]|nr:hypothetical protein A3743_08315 [Oleiphilus sp. HI0072]